MAAITVGGVNHITLTVTDIARSKAFYTDVLGFKEVLTVSPERVILSNDQTLLVISRPWDKSQPIQPDDRFNENRIGLDHLSFSVGNREALEEAERIFDLRGVPHGTINDLSGAGVPIYVLAFRDPDNIQLELTAPK